MGWPKRSHAGEPWKSRVARYLLLAAFFALWMFGPSFIRRPSLQEIESILSAELALREIRLPARQWLSPERAAVLDSFGIQWKGRSVEAGTERFAEVRWVGQPYRGERGVEMTVSYRPHTEWEAWARDSEIRKLFVLGDARRHRSVRLVRDGDDWKLFTRKLGHDLPRVVSGREYFMLALAFGVLAILLQVMQRLLTGKRHAESLKEEWRLHRERLRHGGVGQRVLTLAVLVSAAASWAFFLVVVFGPILLWR